MAVSILEKLYESKEQFYHLQIGIYNLLFIWLARTSGVIFKDVFNYTAYSCEHTIIRAGNSRPTNMKKPSIYQVQIICMLLDMS
jgi:hypothetical protein